MCLDNYALDTVKSYCAAANKFFSFLMEHPSYKLLPHEKRIESYLTWRVKKFDISPSTQNVEFNALIYLHKKIIGVEVNGINSLRARPKLRIPPILSVEQVSALISSMPEEYQLITRVLYGTGMRVNECLRLRLKDIDFANMKIIIHEGKGDKEGIVMLPDALKTELQKQVAFAQKMWEMDKVKGYGVHIPRALELKYKAIGFSRDWYWVFPNGSIAQDPRSKRLQRHHIYDFSVQKAFLEVRRKLKLPEYTTPHALRHAFATHLAQDMLSKGFPQDLVEAKLVQYLRHASKETLRFYVHLAAPKDAVFTLPIDNLEITKRASSTFAKTAHSAQREE